MDEEKPLENAGADQAAREEEPAQEKAPAPAAKAAASPPPPAGAPAPPPPKAGAPAPPPAQAAGAAPGTVDMPNSAEVARIAARWARARDLEQRRKERAERWRKRLFRIRESIAGPWRAMESRAEDVGRALVAPFHGIIEAVQKFREEQENKRREKWLKNLPAREEAARKRWEKKRLRKEARARRMEALRARFSGLNQSLSSPAEKYRALEEKLRDIFMAPFRLIGAWNERIALARHQRRQIKLELTKDSREEAIRKRHTRLLLKEERKRMSRLRWRRRLSGVRSSWQWFRRFWSNTRPIRQILYIIAAIVAIIIYRHEIIDWVSDFANSDLQQLMD